VEILKAASGSNWNVVDQRVAQLKSQPPAIPIGDRRSSRRANDEGLQALRRGDLTTAVRALEQAVSADERDFEVRNNLGHAYYRAGRLPESENSLLRVLTLAPDRTSAWANLSQTVADQGNRGASIAALRLAVRHSANREKTLDYLNQTAATSSSVPYKDVIAVVLREVDSIPRSPGDLSGPAPADAARRAAKQGVTEPTPASASNQNPVASAPAGSAQTTTRRDPRELCKNKSNFLSRAICESRLCARDEDLRDHPYCVELRAKEAQSGRQ
jgi:tetratricopeptide (TPR) repeat protein